MDRVRVKASSVPGHELSRRLTWKQLGQKSVCALIGKFVGFRIPFFAAARRGEKGRKLRDLGVDHI
jgi:hypothetical protein